MARVLERDAVEREIVAAVEHQDARAVLVAALARLLGDLPPRDVLAQHFGPAASVDDAIAHHAGAGDTGAVDHGAAAAAARVDDAATAGADLVDLGIARAEQDRLRVDHERHAGLEIERSGEEGVVRAIGLEHDGLALGAGVEGLLDARGIELRFVGVGDGLVAVDGGERGGEHGAARRDHGLGDGARVLRAGGEGQRASAVKINELLWGPNGRLLQGKS